MIDLAREHDDDVNYTEVEQLLASARPRLVLCETPPVRTLGPHCSEPHRR